MSAFLHRYDNPATPDPTCTTAPFTDVPTTNPFCGPIDWLVTNNITTGYDDDTYRPQLPVSRGAMGAFLHRLDQT